MERSRSDTSLTGSERKSRSLLSDSRDHVRSVPMGAPDTKGSAGAGSGHSHDSEQPTVASHEASLNADDSNLLGVELGWPSERAMEMAATFVTDSMRSRRVGYQFDVASLWWRQLYHSPWYRNFMTFVVVVHMSLILFEEPTGRPHAHVTNPDAIRTGWIELAILALYVWDILLQIRFMGLRGYLSSWNVFEVVCTFLFALDVVTTLSKALKLQFSRVLRPFFIITKRRHIRFIFRGIMRSFPSMIPVLIILMLQIIAFAFAGALVFSKTHHTFDHLTTNRTTVPPYCSVYSPRVPQDQGGCDDYFYTVGSSIYGLFIQVTKANWPNLMLPYYETTQWAGLFFVTFLLIGHFFLHRLLLATSFTDFRSYCTQSYVRQQRRNRAALAAAFQLISWGGYVSMARWKAMSRIVRPDMPGEVQEIIFWAVGGTSGYLGRQGFIAACTLLDVKVERVHLPDDPSGGSEWARRTRRKLAWFFQQPWVEVVVNLAILLAVVCEMLQAAPITDDRTVSNTKNIRLAESKWLRVVSNVLVVLFSLEIGLKMFTMGVKRFWKDGFNRLDLIVTGAALIGVLVAAASSPHSHQTLTFRAAVFLRSARFLRVLRLLRRFWRVLATIRAVLPLVWRIIAVLAILFYVLGTLGMEAFAGVLVPEDELVAKSPYGRSGFYSLNFNSFPRSFMMQFAFLMVTKSPIIVEGLMAGDHSWLPLLYFVVFYLLVVIVAVNVLSALIIQSYQARYALEVSRGKDLVEAWEHLVVQAQVEWHAKDPDRFSEPIRWRLRRPEQFLTLGESLFGESLTLDFETHSLRVVDEFDPIAYAACVAKALRRRATPRAGSVTGSGSQLLAGDSMSQADGPKPQRDVRPRCLTDFVRSPFAFLLTVDNLSAEMWVLSELLDVSSSSSEEGSDSDSSSSSGEDEGEHRQSADGRDSLFSSNASIGSPKAPDGNLPRPDPESGLMAPAREADTARVPLLGDGACAVDPVVPRDSLEGGGGVRRRRVSTGGTSSSSVARAGLARTPRGADHGHSTGLRRRQLTRRISRWALRQMATLAGNSPAAGSDGESASQGSHSDVRSVLSARSDRGPDSSRHRRHHRSHHHRRHRTKLLGALPSPSPWATDQAALRFDISAAEARAGLLPIPETGDGEEDVLSEGDASSPRLRRPGSRHSLDGGRERHASGGTGAGLLSESGDSGLPVVTAGGAAELVPIQGAEEDTWYLLQAQRARLREEGEMDTATSSAVGEKAASGGPAATVLPDVTPGGWVTRCEHLCPAAYQCCAMMLRWIVYVCACRCLCGSGRRSLHLGMDHPLAEMDDMTPRERRRALRRQRRRERRGELSSSDGMAASTSNERSRKGKRASIASGRGSMDPSEVASGLQRESSLASVVSRSRESASQSTPRFPRPWERRVRRDLPSMEATFYQPSQGQHASEIDVGLLRESRRSSRAQPPSSAAKPAPAPPRESSPPPPPPPPPATATEDGGSVLSASSSMPQRPIRSSSEMMLRGGRGGAPQRGVAVLRRVAALQEEGVGEGGVPRETSSMSLGNQSSVSEVSDGAGGSRRRRIAWLVQELERELETEAGEAAAASALRQRPLLNAQRPPG